MLILVDTNVLLRVLHPQHAQYATAEQAISSLRLRGEVLCITPQNVIEFWAVATRPPEVNGLGMTIARAAMEVGGLRRFFHLLPSIPEVIDVWKQIVTEYGVAGKQTHDAHLVAVMKVYSIAGILTFNTGDFKRFPGISVIDPSSL